MARFLIGCLPFVGHINPGLPIARALVERGHEVRWYTGHRFKEKVEATGARYVPMRAAPDFDDKQLEATFPGRAGLSGIAGIKWDIKHIFLDTAVGQLQDFTEILRDYPADVLLSDTTFAGGRFAHEKGGPPWAVYGMMPLPLTSRETAPFGLGMLPDASPLGQLRNRLLNWLFDAVIFRDVGKHHNHLRVRLGLQPLHGSIFDQARNAFLYLQGTVPGFEYPRSDVPPHVHFIGPFLAQPPADFTPPAWWHELDAGLPVVHVTQGTVATDADDLLIPTLQGLAGKDVLVVATTGGQPIEEVRIEPLPANVRLERFIPHAHLLPHVDVMVTNAGYNGVQMALAHGVPLVANGQTEDKPEVCARIEWSGVGINLRKKAPTPAEIGDAVMKVLATPRYKQKAQALQAEIARHDAPGNAVELLARLATTKQPVVERAA